MSPTRPRAVGDGTDSLIDGSLFTRTGVTKGARHKILVSIKKLGEREAAVAAVQAELATQAHSPGATATVVLRALERLRAVLLSPMPPHGALPVATVQALELGECAKKRSDSAPPARHSRALSCSVQVPGGGRARAAAGASSAASAGRARRRRAAAARGPAVAALLAR